MKKTKKFLALVLAACLIFGMLPALAASAADDEGGDFMEIAGSGNNRYLSTKGSNAFNVFMYDNTFSGTFGDQHMGGIEFSLNGTRIATNGDMHMLPTPEQWDATPAPSRGTKVYDTETNTITVPMSFSGSPDGTLKYDLVAEPTEDGFCLKMFLKSDMPEDLKGKARFNLEFRPASYRNKSYQADLNADGVYDTFGVFPLHPQDAMVETERPNLPSQAWYVKEWNTDRGDDQPTPFATGYAFSFSPEDEETAIEIEAANGDLMELYDGRNRAQNGWYVLSTLIQATHPGDLAAEWNIRPHVKEGWVREPNVGFSQVGYSPAQEKFAVVELDKWDNDYPTTMSLWRVNADGSEENVCEKELGATTDWMRFKYARFDFSEVTEAGLYRIHYGDYVGEVFPISKDCYDNIWQTTLSGFLAVQMDHIAVREGYKIWHGASHMDDGTIGDRTESWFDGMSMRPMPDVVRAKGYVGEDHVDGLNKGGWFDAGDFDLQISRNVQVLGDLVNAGEILGRMDNYDDLSVEWDDATGGVVEMHRPDGIPDVVQQCIHGSKQLLAEYESLGGTGGCMEVRTLRQYTHLGDPSSDTDGWIYDPNLEEGEVVERDGKVYSGVPDDRYFLTAGGGGSFSAGLSQNICNSFAGTAYMAVEYPATQDYAQHLFNVCIDRWKASNWSTNWDTVVQFALASAAFEKAGVAYDDQDTLSAAYFKGLLDELIPNNLNANSHINVLALKDLLTEEQWAQVGESVAAVNVTENNQPYGVNFTSGASWGSSPNTYSGVRNISFMYYHFPLDKFEKNILRSVDYLLGRHPATNSSWISGVGTKSMLHPYNSNRAEESYIPGSILPGHITFSDYVESMDDFNFLWFENESIINYQSSWLPVGLAAGKIAHNDPEPEMAQTKDFESSFSAELVEKASSGGWGGASSSNYYFSDDGFNMIMYATTFDRTFGDQHCAGIELIQDGRRIATNGDIHLLPTPEQWDATPPPSKGTITAEGNTVTVPMTIPEETFTDGTPTNPAVNYRLIAEPEQGGIKLTVQLDEPLPADLVGSAGFNLEFLPAVFIGKSFQADSDGDGTYDSFGVFPKDPRDEMVEMNRARTNNQAWYVQEWNEDRGDYQPLPFATGNKMTFAAEDDDYRIRISSDDGLALYDGRNRAQNGWFVLRTLIPEGATEIVWHISPDTNEGWVREPNISHNQAGYEPELSKVAVIELDPNYSGSDTASVKRVNADGSFTEVFSGPLGEAKTWQRYVYRDFDFSEVKTPGTYVIEYDGFVSDQFPIDKGVYSNIWTESIGNYMAVQMDHMRIREGYKIWRNAAHMDDALQAPVGVSYFDGQSMGNATDSKYEAYEHIPYLDQGGFSDAGDFDIQVAQNLGVINTLTMAYQVYGEDYDTLDCNWDTHNVELHRSDGTADLVELAKHGALNIYGQIKANGYTASVIEVPSLRQYTHLGDGAKDTDNRIYDASLAEDEVDGLRSGKRDDRLAFFQTKSTGSLMNAIQAMAGAASIMDDSDPDKAKFIESAEELWNEDPTVHEGVETEVTMSFGNYTFTYTTGPQDWNAAIQLFAATGKDVYKNRILECLDYELSTSGGGGMWGGGGGGNFGSAGWRVIVVLDKLGEEAKAKFEAALAEYAPTIGAPNASNPYGVSDTMGMWGGSGGVVSGALTASVLHKYYPDVVSTDSVFRAINYILGTHPYNSTSWISGVGTKSVTKGYGSNRADFYYIAGGLAPGYVTIAPDFPEHMDDFNFLWFENEYTVEVTANWILLTLGADDFARETDEECEHDWQPRTKAATCESDGYREYICTKCFEVNDEMREVLPALGHDFDDGVITKDPLVGFEGEKTFTCRRCGLKFTEPVPPLEGEIDMSNIDFTTSEADGRFVIDFPGTAERRDETGLYVPSTTASFETTGEDFKPSDVIKIPVTGDWTATMKFNASVVTSAWGGNTDYLGFYVMDNFENGVGMRANNGSIENWTRKNGSVSANNAAVGPAASANGLNTNDRVHWYRIEKNGDNYVCSYSADGEEFTELFNFTDTGVDGKMLVIDAYKTGWSFGGTNSYNIEYLNFDVKEPKWLLASEIEPGKTYVIVADGQYALNNKTVQINGVDDLGATAVTVEGNKITSEVTDDMKWTINEATDVSAALNGEQMYFIFDQDGQQLLRRSGSTGTAPVNVGTMDPSKKQYATWSFHKRAGGQTRAVAEDTPYSMYVNSWRSNDYFFVMNGTEAGFNAPGGAQNSYSLDTNGSEIRLYTEGYEEPVKLDTEALEAAIADAEAVDTAPYTEESVAAFEEALAAAKTALESAQTQEEIDAAAEALINAKAALTEAETPIEHPELPIWENQYDYSFAERAADLIARMSVAQKGSQLVSTASAISASALGGGALNVPATKDVPSYEWWSEALHGYSRGQTSGAVIYPQNLTMASTWNPELYYRQATEIGNEIREKTQTNSQTGNSKNLNFYSPTVNMHRDPRWGRNEESFSEDVYLTGKMASEFVKGMEGKDRDGNLLDPDGYLKTMCTVKHYVANTSERNRLNGGATSDLRALREYYAAPYREVIQQADVRSVMTAYSTFNGEPSSYSSYLMDTLLRQTYGFNGHITSDCDSVATQNRLAYVNPYTGDTMTDIEALAGSLAHGEDLECNGGYSGFGTYSSKLSRMIDAAPQTDKGVFTENAADVGLLHMFTDRIATGEFDENLAYTAAAAERVANGESGQSAERLAIIDEVNREGVVLLKNNGVLPLQIPEGAYNVVIVGNWQTQTYTGLYSAGVSGNSNVNIQKGITDAIKAVNADATVTYITSDSLTDENKEAIAAADVAVVVVGTNSNYSKEDGDRTSIALPNNLDTLISTVGQLNDKTVAVMETCGPMQVKTFENDVAALLWSSYGGLRKGVGFGDIITGAANPSGKLTETWYQDVSDAGESDVPSIYDYNLYATNGSNGRTYMYYVGEKAPSYPFGYGLSYTTFEYSDLTIDKTAYDANDTVKVSFKVKNTGSVAGKEITQLYIAQPDAPAELNRPIRRLEGFEKIELQPGETKTVEMEVAIPDLAFFDETDKRFEVDTGAYQVQVGKDSASANLTADFTVSGEMDVYPVLLTVKANQVGDTEQGIEERVIFDKGAIVNPQLTVAMNDESLCGYVIANQQSPIDQVQSSPLPEGMTFTYKSNRPSVVSCTGGQIKAVNAGVATVTVTGKLDDIELTADFVVYVEANPYIDGITLNGEPMEGFNREKFGYELDAAAYDEAPEVGFISNTEGLTITVEQFEGIPGVATVTSVDEASGTTAVYRIGLGNPPVSTDFSEGWDAAVAKGWTVAGENEVTGFGEDGLTLAADETNFYSEPAFGEWAAQTKVTLPEALSANGQQAGLIVKDTDDTYVKLVYEQVTSTGWWARTNYYVTAYSVVNGEQAQVARSGNLGTLNEMNLRVIKSGGAYTFAYSADGENWTDMSGTAKVGMADPKIGPYVSGIAATFDGINVCKVSELYPRLASVKLNGAVLTEFDPETFVYNFVAEADDAAPVFEATGADETINVEITQMDTATGVATIRAYNDVTEAVYKFYFDLAPVSDYLADGEIGDRWTIERENAETYSIEKGKGVVLPTQSGDIHGTGGAWENCFVMPAQGNWQAVAKIVYPNVPTANYQQAMFLVWQDENNYVRMNCQTSNLNMEPGVEQGGSFNGNLGNGVALPAEDGTVTLYFMIDKAGNDYTVGYSQDGVNFTRLNTAKNVNFANPKIGLFATQNSSSAQMNMYYEYVAVTWLNGVEQMTYPQMNEWAAQNVADYIAADLPDETNADLELSPAPHGYDVELSAAPAGIIDAEGKVTIPEYDTNVKVTVKASDANAEASAEKTIKVLGEKGPNPEQPALGDIDFSDPADNEKYAIVGQTDGGAEQTEDGRVLKATRNAVEPCNGQNTGDNANTPEDLIEVPVEGDWTATLKFNFAQAGARGWYSFFGFYAAEGEDYQNMAGIRGGDGAMQNFLRVNGEVTADSADLNSAPGLAADGDYWFRIKKEGTTYTCYRSADGATFDEMFSYADTGIEATKLVIDAYTGMAEGYTYTLDTLTFGEGEEPPVPVVDRTALDKAIADAEAVDKDLYTDETVAALEEALAAAKAVPEDADQAAVDAAAEALNAAIDALEAKPVVDKTALEEAIAAAEAEAATVDVYTDESLAALNEALEAAKAVQEDPDATQDEVDAAAQALNEAIEALEVEDIHAYLEKLAKDAQALAEEAKAAAEAAQAAADAAAQSAAADKEAAEAAKAAAEAAQAKAEQAQKAAEDAKAAAEAADADAAAQAVEAAAQAAEAAKQAAEAAKAQAAAQAAQEKAEEAQAAAEAAQAAAEAAEAAAGADKEAADAAKQAAEAAQKQAEAAQKAADAAKQAADASNAAAAEAAQKAAEEAAKVAKALEDAAELVAKAAEDSEAAEKAKEAAEKAREEAEAAALAAEKSNAKTMAAIAALGVDTTDFTPEQMAELEKILDDAADAIDAAEDSEGVQKALEDAVKALEELAGEEPPFRFDDVQDESKFYFEPVYWAYEAEPQITNGKTANLYGPDDGCTRGQVVTFLWRAAGCPEPKSADTPFTDLKEGAFYLKAVAWAVENEITNGTSETTFSPDDTCTRGQIVTFLWRFKGTPEPKSTETKFTDVPATAFYAKAVAWAVENDVTKGMTDTTFVPNNTCTRGQVVTFLYRAMEGE